MIANYVAAPYACDVLYPALTVPRGVVVKNKLHAAHVFGYAKFNKNTSLTNPLGTASDEKSSTLVSAKRMAFIPRSQSFKLQNLQLNATTVFDLKLGCISLTLGNCMLIV